MTIQVDKSPEYRTEGALNLINELKEASNQATAYTEVAPKVLDCLYEKLAEINQDVSFYVRCNSNDGYDKDFLDGMSKEDWDEKVWNGNRDFTNMHSITYNAAQELFCELLGNQVLSNIPHDLEQAKRHVLINVFSVFNGANFLHRRFELIYINYDLFGGRHVETEDLTDMLILPEMKVSYGI